MARPRLPSNVLELRGSFKKHPERARKDLPGVGTFETEPPEYLTGEEKAAWREIIAELPLIALSGSDRKGATQLARLWAALKTCSPLSGDWKRLDDAFRAWSVQMGLTLQARAKLGTPTGRGNESPSRPQGFGRFRKD